MPQTFATHDVLNQSPPFEDVNLFTLDQPLVEAVKVTAGAAASDDLAAFGGHWGSAAMAQRGRVANENTPKLRLFDAKGFRRDEVEFHPAYHELMAHSAHAGLHNSTWTTERAATWLDLTLGRSPRWRVSSTTTRMPRHARSSASVRPTGPAPTTRTSASSFEEFPIESIPSTAAARSPSEPLGFRWSSRPPVCSFLTLSASD